MNYYLNGLRIHFDQLKNLTTQKKLFILIAIGSGAFGLMVFRSASFFASPLLSLPAILAGLFLFDIFYFLTSKKPRLNFLPGSDKQKLTKLYQLANLGQRTNGLLHDLANPLTALNLNLYYLNRQKAKEPEQKIFLRQSLKSAQKIQKLLALNQKELKNAEEKTIFSPSKEIKRVLENLNYQLKINQIKIKLVAAKNIELYGSIIKFNQAIANLVLNSIEAYQNFKIKEKIIFIGLNELPRYYQLTLADLGPGLKKEEQQKIFAPFFSTKTEHAGLGLFWVKEIVERDFGGRIIVSSQINRGVNLDIYLAKTKINQTLKI